MKVSHTNPYRISGSPVLSYLMPLLAMVLLLSPACQFGGSVDDSGSALLPDANKIKPENAPLPFTIEDLRSAPLVGRSFKYRLEIIDEPLFFVTIRFIDSDGESITIEASSIDEKSKKNKKSTVRKTWEEILGAFAFKEEQTKIFPRIYTAPEGVYDCLVYRVTTEKGGKEEVSDIWFLKSPPYVPVYADQKVDGKLCGRVILVESN